MSTVLGSLGLAVLDHHIYAIGGYDGTTALKTVERYNPCTNIWDEVASLRFAREGVTAESAKCRLNLGYSHVNQEFQCGSPYPLS